jgi:hypothetical protein
LANPSKLDALLRGIAGQAPESKYIRAYHGSRAAQEIMAGGFDPRFIGRENGTAQGHGYYFTEDPALARWYGDPVPVEIAVPSHAVADWYAPARRQGDLLDRFAAAVEAAPENRWKGDAFAELMRKDGQAQLAYQSLLRAHNVGNGSQRLGRYEAGRRASEALVRHGILGGHWVDDMAAAPGLRNVVMFPGTEDSIRILRKYGVMAPVPVAAGTAGATMEDQ